MSDITRRRFLRSAALSGAVLSHGSAFALTQSAQQAVTEANEIVAPDWTKCRLFYERPAATWPDALPVGNGRLGAMVFGRPALERIQLNEESIWDGEVRDRDNPRAGAAVPEIRRLLFAGKVHEAEAMAVNDMLSIPRRMPCYQTLGDLHLDFSASGLVQAKASASSWPDNYLLTLDLDRAIVTTTFVQDGVHHVREVFVSAPDQVIVVRLSVSRPGKLSFSATLDRPSGQVARALSHDSLALSAEALPVNDNPGQPVKERQVGVRFLAHLQALAEGGTVTSTPAANGTPASLLVTGADAVTLLIDCATSYRYPARDEDMTAAVEKHLHAAALRSYTDLRERHIADHRTFFRRSAIELGVPDAVDPKGNIATDLRLQAVKNGGEDLGLQQLYFHFGRYMLISSSRPGTLAANLQGIWNDSLDPPWGSKYTMNINTEMNYWITERANLADLHTSLFDLLDTTRPAGARVARTYYHSGGSVVHHNTDLWGDAGPIDGLGGGIWPIGAAWMTTQVWDSFQYSGDVAFLRARAYPRLREAAVFLLDYLTPSPNGELVTGPSCSPENAYRLPDGTKANLCMGPTMDIEITRAIFRQATEAAQLLGLDGELIARIKDAARRLPSYKIGRFGNLQEWQVDYAETEPGHRHISHMWALYPNDAITLRGTPKLAEACRVTLNRRLQYGSGSTGWSRAWFLNCFARLEDGDRCHQQLLELLRHSTRENLFDVCGIKPNSYYQIDGNLGGAAGMVEMLLQSHAGVVRLLPALPSAWPDGRFLGLRARGGLTIDLVWREGKVRSATLHAALDGVQVLATPRGQRIASVMAKGRPVALSNDQAEGVYRLRVRRGESYSLLFA